MTTEKMEHFKEDEFKCKCGKCDGGKMSEELLFKLQIARKECGFPFKITSAFRCRPHNIAVKGSPNSQHLRGNAVDVYCTDSRKRYALVQALMACGFRGIGVAKTFIHGDVRQGEARIWFYQ